MYGSPHCGPSSDASMAATCAALIPGIVSRGGVSNGRLRWSFGGMSRSPWSQASIDRAGWAAAWRPAR